MGKTQFAEAGQTQKENKTFRVYATPEERAQIIATAKACGLSVSAFLRKLALGYEPQPLVDHDAIENLARVNADQGRLGGLLKMWLTDREKYNEAQMVSVSRLLEDLIATQKQLRKIIADLLAGFK